MADKPVTREEKYLAYLTGDYTGELPKPITRKEKYLYELCLKGIGGEVSPEEIKSAVNEYLEKNPVKPGATTEQAQQIEQNKKDVVSLKEETGSLKEDLGDLATFGKNLFNKETATIGYTLDNNGELTNDSSVIPNASQYLTSNFIPCENYVGMYFCIAPENGAVCFYDNNKKFISKISNILYNNGRKIIKNSSYLRFSTPKSQLNTTTARVFDSMPLEAPSYDEYGTKLNENLKIPSDNTKLNKNQGSDNVGKYIKVEEDGNLTPDDPPVDDRMYIGKTVTNAGQQEETISIGVGAGRNMQNGYIAIGHGAMGVAEESTMNDDNGKYSVAIGHRALGANTTGDHNTAVGWGCLGGNKTGNGNTAVGEDALCHSVEGNNNTCIGNRAYQMGLGSNNVVIGATAMYSSISGKNTPTGNSNVAVGAGSGAADGNGDNNTAIGTGAKQDANLRFSTAIGALAEAHKSRQVVIGSTKSGTSHPLESILNGDIIICGTDMKFRKLIFNDDGTIKWEDVSENYSEYTN